MAKAFLIPNICYKNVGQHLLKQDEIFENKIKSIPLCSTWSETEVDELSKDKAEKSGHERTVSLISESRNSDRIAQKAAQKSGERTKIW